MRLERSTWLLGLVGYQLASGLVLVLGQDGAVQQALLAGHAATGPLAALAFLRYVPGHLARVRRAPRPIARMLGLVAALLLGVAFASGLLILGRSALALHTADVWRDYHQVLGLAGCTALAVHLVIVARSAPGRAAMRSATRIFATCAILALALAAVAPRLDPGAIESLIVTKVPSELAAAGSNAWSASRGCGAAGCHEEAYREWEASAHGHADRDPYYRALEERLARERQFDTLAKCNECHDPVMLGDGRFSRWVAEGARGDIPHSGEAVGCLVCHAMAEAHGRLERGNYVLKVPRRAPFQDTLAGAALLRAFPAPHARAHSPPLYEKSKLCAACHRPDVAQPIAGFGLLRIENPHARWALAGVKPSCQECHMPRAEEAGPMSHRFPGSSAHLSPDPEQQRMVTALLAGEIELPGVTGDLTRGPLLVLSAGPGQLTTDGGLTLEVALRHPGRIGHQFPAGAQDLVQLWIEGELTSGARVLARWGEHEPGGPFLPGTPVFRRGGFHRYPDGVREVEPSWQQGGVPFPVLRPGDTHALTLHAPALPVDLRDPPTLELTLRYRKVSRAALDAIGSPGLPLPPAFVLARGQWVVEIRR